MNAISSTLLEKKQFHPSWENIQAWSKLRDLEILRRLITDGRLCKLIDESVFSYRHDRIQEEYFIRVLQTKINESENFNQGIFQEPYYSHLIGKSLVKCNKTIDYLEEISLIMPTILFEALKSFKIPSSKMQHNIITKLIEWVNNKKNYELLPESILKNILDYFGNGF